jgi:hypothetical protein
MEICMICGYESPTYKGLSVHVSVTHKLDMKDYLDTYVYEGSPRCLHCGSELRWTNRGYRECSIRCDIKGVYEECVICKLRCYNLSDLSIHVKKIHGLDFKSYLDDYVYKGNLPKCSDCGSLLLYSKGKYQGCSSRCHLPEVCRICGKHFLDSNRLSQHISHVHQLKNFKDYLDKYVPGNPPKCGKCGADLLFESGSYTNKCSMRCEAEFKCKICGMGCALPETLTRHVHKYHGLDSKSYVTQYDWDNHPPKCNCGSTKTFYKGKYRDWCPKCNKYHAYQHCERGWFLSDKAEGGKFYYRSSLEYKACFVLEHDLQVKLFSKGPIIPLSNGSDYLVDFYVEYWSGNSKLIEVKPQNNVLDIVVQEKIHSASVYARDNKIDEVLFWTEKNLSVFLCEGEKI